MKHGNLRKLTSERNWAKYRIAGTSPASILVTVSLLSPEEVKLLEQMQECYEQLLEHWDERGKRLRECYKMSLQNKEGE